MTPPADEAEPLLAIRSAAVEIGRIVALKLDHRGDFVMARGALEALRAGFPGAHVTLVCGGWNREAALRTGLFDRVLACNFFPESVGHEGLVIGDARSLQDFAALLAGERFDLAIDLRLHPETRALLPLLDAGLRAGFGDPAAFPFLDIALPLPNPTESGRSRSLGLRADRFGTTIGSHAGDAIVSPEPLSGQPPGHILVFGPYADLEAGLWEIRLEIEPLAAPFTLGFDVTATGDDVLGVGAIRVERDAAPTITLHLAEAAKGVEIRLLVPASGAVGPFRLAGAVARRRGVFAGPHQAEMQYLLCCLAAFRLRQPWRVAEAAG